MQCEVRLNGRKKAIKRLIRLWNGGIEGSCGTAVATSFSCRHNYTPKEDENFVEVIDIFSRWRRCTRACTLAGRAGGGKCLGNGGIGSGGRWHGCR